MYNIHCLYYVFEKKKKHKQTHTHLVNTLAQTKNLWKLKTMVVPFIFIAGIEK